MLLISVPFELFAGLHPKLSEQTKKTSELMYSTNVADFSVDSLAALLQLYPIHVVKREDEGSHWVIAGLRQFELLSVFHAKNTSSKAAAKTDPLNSIPVLVHDKATTREIQQLAAIDVAGSAILFSLGAKFAALANNIIPIDQEHHVDKVFSYRV